MDYSGNAFNCDLFEKIIARHIPTKIVTAYTAYIKIF